MLFIFILSDLDGDTKSILSKFIDYGECLIPYMTVSIQRHLGNLCCAKMNCANRNLMKFTKKKYKICIQDEYSHVLVQPRHNRLTSSPAEKDLTKKFITVDTSMNVEQHHVHITNKSNYVMSFARGIISSRLKKINMSLLGLGNLCNTRFYSGSSISKAMAGKLESVQQWIANIENCDM